MAKRSVKTKINRFKWTIKFENFNFNYLGSCWGSGGGGGSGQKCPKTGNVGTKVVFDFS